MPWAMPYASPQYLHIDARQLSLQLQGLREEVAAARETLDSLATTSNDNASRLEVIEGLVRGLKTPVGARAARYRDSPRVWITVCVALLSLLLMRKLRRLVQGGLRSLPLPVLALTQAFVGAALLAHRGHDLMEVLLHGQSERAAGAARSRRLLFHVLLLSCCAVPAKGLAHLVPLPAKSSVRVRE
jgi:hypothetical protein